MKGTTLGPYRILREVGAGGMGTVCLAEVLESVEGLPQGGRVALKILHPHLLQVAGFRRRFGREAEIGRDIHHENVVRILGSGSAPGPEGNAYFLIMEYVEGRTLRELLRDLQQLPEALLREIARQVAAGLSAIHAEGVVHRDIKPENVLITDDQHVRIMDLGVARLEEPTSVISEEGQFAGSLLYAAPEQFSTQTVSGAADLYSLGVTLYELATGKNPFRRSVAASVIQAHLTLVPPLASDANPDLSPFFTAVLSMLLTKDVELRFPSAAELCDVLQRGERSTWWADREARVLEVHHHLPRISVGRTTQVYGRQRELAALTEAWQEARVGRGRTVLVEGEAGIGKTRLIDAFLTEQGGSDVNVLYGAYSPSGGRGGLSSGILDHFGSRDLELGLEPNLVDLLSLVPSFAAAIRHEATPEGCEPLRPEALHTLMVALMRGLAAQKPLIWIVDDLHFSGPESRRVVLSLARAVRRHAVLLVVCTRPGLPEEDLTHFRRLETTRQVSVDRLSPRQVIELLRESFRSEGLADKLGGKIAYKSDGVPFFVFELIRGLREGRFIEERDDGAYIETRVVEEIEVPSAVRDLVEGRLSDLRDGERNLLDAASVQGLEFDGDLLARVCGMKRIEVLQLLAAIERRTHLIRASGASYRFDHNQLHDVILGGLAVSLRREYCTLTADAFREREGLADVAMSDLPGEAAVFLATNYLQGSRPADCLPMLVQALEHLGDSYRREAAVSIGRQALGTEDLLESAQRVEVLLLLTGWLNVIGHRELERALLDEAQEVVAGLDDATLQCRVAMHNGAFAFATSQYDAAEEAYRAALELSLRAGERVLEARAVGGLGNSCLRTARYEEAREHFQRSFALAREAGARGPEAASAGNLGIAFWYLAQFEDARAQYEAQLSISREDGRRRGEALALGNLGLVHSRLGRLDDARACFEQSLAIHLAEGDRRGEAWTRHSLASLMANRGLHGDAVRQAERSLLVAQEIEDRRTVELACSELALSLHRLGRHEQARKYAEMQFEVAEETSHSVGMANARHILALISACAGDARDVVRELEEVCALHRERGNAEAEARVIDSLVGVHMTTGDDDSALALLEELLRDAPAPGGDAPLGDGDGVFAVPRIRRALLRPEYLEAARVAFDEWEGRLDHATRLEAHWLLWQATQDHAHLSTAHDLLELVCRNAPSEDQASMLEEVPLYRSVTKAWEEHGVG